MNIDANIVKKLREITGAGILDCKKALVESNGNIEKSIDYLREKGISTSAKKADRIAAEGLTKIYVDGNKATIIEVNSETDFVAKNENFKILVDKIGNLILKNDVNTMEEALKLKDNEDTIENLIINLTAKIKEKLSFRRFEKVIKSEDEIFGSYIHTSGKISSLIVLKGENETIAKDIAMQVTAMSPKYISRNDVPEEVLNHEKEILEKQALEEGKKLEFIDKIINGRIEKFYSETCLLDQKFIKDDDKTVKQYLDDNNAIVKYMFRYEVGEGMEKRVDDFEKEVRNQLNN